MVSIPVVILIVNAGEETVPRQGQKGRIMGVLFCYYGRNNLSGSFVSREPPETDAGNSGKVV
jgi:hypothetical protein